jgi:hypothetical protein
VRAMVFVISLNLSHLTLRITRRPKPLPKHENPGLEKEVIRISLYFTYD